MEVFNSVVQSNHKTIAQVAVLLCRYGFELGGLSPLELIDDWLTSYSQHWIRLAIVEALYQGRYKAVSIEQILRLWKRRGRPTYHFTYEFERLICGHLLLARSTMGEKKSQYSLTNSQKDTIINQPPVETPLPLNRNRNTSETPQVPVSIMAENAPKILDNLPLSTDSPPLKIESDQDSLEIRPSLLSETPLTLTNRKTPDLNVMAGRSIDQFVPHADSSQLYGKLWAVVHQELAE